MLFMSKTKRKLIKKFKIFIWMLGATLTVLACSSVGLLANNASSQIPNVWLASGLERIGRTEKPKSANSIQLYAARGEYEPFQIGIQASSTDLTNVNVSVSDLTSANKEVISKNNITLYREHYVYVKNPSSNKKGSTNLSLGPGWYADALIPFANPETKMDLLGAELDAVPFTLKAGNNQPIWVDIFVPRNTPPGQYQGTYTVSSNQGVTTGNIFLKVWNFQLPLKPSLNSEFAFYESDNTGDMLELLKHKVMPEAEYNPADERKLIEQWGLHSRSLDFWSGADLDTCKMDQAPSVDQVKTEAAKHQPALFLYARYADEIDKCLNLIEPMKQWAQNFHKAGASTAVAMTPTPELYDDGSGTGRSAVDIWIVLPEMYDADPKRISEVLKKGDKVWFYNALVQDGYSPKWQIDFHPINYRIPHGFINQSLGLTGVLYWRVDFWTKDPWNDVQTHSIKDNYYPGEGMLVYPGKQVGLQTVVPSMRLKWVREGVEDYEYIEILKKLGRQKWALEVGQTVGRDWQNWTRDPKVLESARKQLGDEIERLARLSSSVASTEQS